MKTPPAAQDAILLPTLLDEALSSRSFGEQPELIRDATVLIPYPVARGCRSGVGIHGGGLLHLSGSGGDSYTRLQRTVH